MCVCALHEMDDERARGAAEDLEAAVDFEIERVPPPLLPPPLCPLPCAGWAAYAAEHTHVLQCSRAAP